VPPLIVQDLVDLLPWFIAACSLVALAFVIFRSFPPKAVRGVEKLKPSPQPPIPASTGSTVSELELERAQNELKTLRIEMDIVSYALTKLFESEAQGKITEEERDRLLSKYKEDMRRLEKSIEEREMIVNLYKLESMQSSLLDMFHRRFDEISSRIEEVRSELGLKPKAAPEISVEKTRKEGGEPQESSTASKTQVEEQIREIREKVMRELEKLEQIEVEETNNELDRQDEAKSSY